MSEVQSGALVFFGATGDLAYKKRPDLSCLPKVASLQALDSDYRS